MPETATYTEEELIRLLKARDQTAFSSLYDNYSGAVYGVISRIVPEEESAQDILQETFVKVWNHFASYDASKGRLFTWLINIARNMAIDHTRSRLYKADLKNQSLSNSVNKINRQQSSQQNTDTIGLKSFVGKLKPEHKEIIDLLYFGGYTQEEVSKELNMPLGTVKTRTRAALQQLRELLK
ncbi:MAG TPA: sigma-70 family RNA polymerase sigma factor [Bacteroidia bacterium]|nr:sigma-70 family RNA polymerase sigma factor [Bacteroidia bacterium]